MFVNNNRRTYLIGDVFISYES